LLDLQNNYRSQKVVVEQGNLFMGEVGGKPSIAKSDRAYEDVQHILSNKIFIEQRASVPAKENLDERYKSFIFSRGERKNIDVTNAMARTFKACHHIIRGYPLNTTTFMVLTRTNKLAYGYESLRKFKKKLRSCFSPKEIAGFQDFDTQVQCMSAHRSKGAEADIVIVLNVEEGVFPMYHSDTPLYRLVGDDPARVSEEEERLFYVAITRAKQSLYLITQQDRESEYMKRIVSMPKKIP